MKKIFLLVTIFSLVFTSCDPLEDINTEIDAQENAIIGTSDYTLVSDDYSSLELDNPYFNTLSDAKTMIPGFLSDKYPVWGDKSSVLVGFELEAGTDIEEVVAFTTASRYTLANTDYPGAGDNAVGFYEDETPGDFIPTVLANSIASPTEGQIVRAKYKQYVGATVLGISEYYAADFQTAGTLLDYTTVDLLGAQTWEETNSYGAKMSGYSGGAQPNEDWLISPEIDFTSQSNLKLQINQVMRYGTWDLIDVVISKDFTGDVATATWDVITLTNIPPGNSWSFVLSDEYDLAAYEGETVHLAFKYTSNATESATWEIGQVTIKTPGVEGTTETKEAFYMYSDGDWESVDKAYYLNAADYDSMGESSGQPGRYNNFSSSTPPNNYIPTFLSTKFPFAQNEDKIFIYYKYYSGGASIKGNKFTFMNGIWMPHQTKLQFGYEGNAWVPDNTIKYTLTRAGNSDYDYMESQLNGNSDFESLPGFGNISLSNFSNYDDFDYNWSEDHILFALGILADHIDPSAAEGQKYLFTYIVYDRGEQERTKWIKKNSGNWILK